MAHIIPRVEANGAGGRGPVTINVNVRGGAESPERLARSGRQVARAVRRAIAEVED